MTRFCSIFNQLLQLFSRIFFSQTVSVPYARVQFLRGCIQRQSPAASACTVRFVAAFLRVAHSEESERLDRRLWLERADVI